MENLYGKAKKYFERENDKTMLEEFTKSFDENSDNEKIAQYLENNSIIMCSECGELEHKTYAYIYDDKYICSVCYDNNYETCDNCGAVMPRDLATYCDSNSQYYCEMCAEDNLTYCEHCENYVINDDIRRVYYSDSRSDDYEYMCIDCIDNSDISYCDECGAYIREYTYLEDSDVCLCDSCHRIFEEQTGGAFIQNYGYKPTPVFYTTPEEKDKGQQISYFGVELEIDRKEDNQTTKEMLEQVNEILGEFAYYKHDGSLSNSGVEIVTHPASLKKWQQQKENWQKVFEICVKSGYRSHNTSCCGLHIHANRKALAEDREEQDNIIDKIILILETFKSQVKKFSRRQNYGYCQFLSDKVYDTPEDKEEYIKKIENIKKEKGKFGRYVTLNVENYNTIELRVMRGTLNIETFIASIQFFNNIIEIAKSNTLEQLNGLMWNNIIELNNFEELQAYNEKRNIENDVILKIRREKESK